MVSFAQIETVKIANGLSTEGVCSILGISEGTYYEWKKNGIPVNSKLRKLLQIFVDDTISLIKRHADEFKED